MTDAPELLPCPFCGSDHIAQEYGIGGEPYMSCVDCGANVEGKAGTWNTRTPDPRVAALVVAARPYVSPVQNADYARQLRQHDALVAALAAFKGCADG